MPSDYLSGLQVAHALGLGKEAAYALLTSHPTPFPVVRSGRRFRVLRADLEAYLTSGSRQATVDVEAVRAAVRETLVEIMDPIFLRPEFRPPLPMVDRRVQVNQRSA